MKFLHIHSIILLFTSGCRARSHGLELATTAATTPLVVSDCATGVDDLTSSAFQAITVRILDRLKNSEANEVTVSTRCLNSRMDGVASKWYEYQTYKNVENYINTSVMLSFGYDRLKSVRYIQCNPALPSSLPPSDNSNEICIETADLARYVVHGKSYMMIETKEKSDSEIVADAMDISERLLLELNNYELYDLKISVECFHPSSAVQIESLVRCGEIARMIRFFLSRDPGWAEASTSVTLTDNPLMEGWLSIMAEAGSTSQVATEE